MVLLKFTVLSLLGRTSQNKKEITLYYRRLDEITTAGLLKGIGYARDGKKSCLCQKISFPLSWCSDLSDIVIYGVSLVRSYLLAGFLISANSGETQWNLKVGFVHRDLSCMCHVTKPLPLSEKVLL